ncbi:MAG: PQQ-dependent sugar dehydrogenase [Candidatus Yanofskybacteria bacterium]|nr:PQQ-dependent sugar dehydrogenase [Candidatus Yanofskybacteria bacterium]
MGKLKVLKSIVCIFVIVLVVAVLFQFDSGPVKKVDFLSVPEGFQVTKFAEGLINPRVIAFDPKGRMLISEPQEGKVLILEDKNKDDAADSKKVLLDGLRLPHGLDFYKDSETGTIYLYVAETHRVARYVYDVKTGDIDEAQKTSPQTIANLPADGGHFTRTIALGPNYRTQPILNGQLQKETMSETKLYISVGSSCDVCVETETWKRAAILESDPEGSFVAEFAGGLRNSVFFTFHPVTGEIWATEMGRDNLGDELPPDEINMVKVAGQHDDYGAKKYGWPFCYGDRTRDNSFNPSKIDRTDIPTDCAKTYPPAIEIPAHSAPLGLAFITSNKWPKEWRNDLLVAYHGSWNRSEPRGYKIVRFELDENGLPSETLAKDGVDFITGFYDGRNTLGRPVDIKFGPDGALYISDDAAGIIFRVSPN